MSVFRSSIIFWVLLLTSSLAVAKEDPCGSRLPASLKAGLHRQYPGLRLVQVADYLAEDVDAHKKEHHGDPCLAVASADVDGDGVLDFGVLLTDDNNRTMLVAALRRPRNRWEISTLWDVQRSGVQRLYVDNIAAGAYRDLFDTDSSPSEYTEEPGRVRQFTAKHAGFISGATEASGVAYFYTGKGWVHLWLSD